MRIIHILFFLSFNVFANEWIDFEWSKETIDGTVMDKTAILINIEGGGKLQLDTGSPSSYLYQPRYQFNNKQKFNLTTTNGRLISEFFEVHKSASSKNDVVGTLGASYFKNSILIIDFDKRKLLKTNKIPDYYKKHSISYIEGQVTENLHIVTQVKIGNVELAPVVFDTGSSIFKLVVNKKDWLSIVPHESRLEPKYLMKVNAWGRTIKLMGADSIAPICLGSICTEGKVFYSDDPQLDFSKAGLSGLVGNAILGDEYTLILDYANKRVGVLKP